MKWKLNIKRELKVSVALIAIASLIAFSERKQGSWICHNIVIELDNESENHFMDEADILRLVNAGQSTLIGTTMDRINLKTLETKLKYDRHILDAELFGDLKGNLVVKVELRRPIARIIRDNAPDAYVAEDGTIMSVSEKYTARVLLISGAFAGKLIDAGNMYELEEGKQLMEMMEFVNDDRFWRSQVAQMDVDRNGEITIYPQVTGQRIEFGKPEDVEAKFRKLMIFYKEILPTKGWTKYERVNLKYEGQIIAE
ncbi:MAG TPA: cell division protein FtsQ [Cyclobacteriaceae bacterium]|nr:cell division protein FtsQ [Cyclobacteriaceae bacterium]